MSFSRMAEGRRRENAVGNVVNKVIHHIDNKKALPNPLSRKISTAMGREIIPSLPRFVSVLSRKYPGRKGKGYPLASLAGSLTVEAAVLLPLLILALYMFWTFFTAMLIQVKLQLAMDQVTAAAAEKSYALSAAGGEGAPADGGLSFGGVLTEAAFRTYAKQQIRKICGKEALKASPMKGKFSLTGSSWSRSGDVSLRVTYRLTFPGLPGLKVSLRVQQRSLRKCWTGNQVTDANAGEAGTASDYVFVTEWGKVYHRDINCYHLHVTVKEVAGSSVSKQRSKNGAKYYPCEHCATMAEVPAVCYITPEGNRWHAVRSCGGLKRGIKCKPLAEVSLPPCSNCGKEEGA